MYHAIPIKEVTTTRKTEEGDIRGDSRGLIESRKKEKG